MSRRVVITGLGLVTPLGLRVEQSWHDALLGISGITPLDLPGKEHSPVRGAGSVRESDWHEIQRMFNKEAKIYGERRTLFALWAAKCAFDDSRLETPSSNHRVGVVLAAGLGITRLEDVHRWTSTDGRFDFFKFARECSEVHGESIVRNLAHDAASAIGKNFHLCGPNFTVTTACASATQALGLAFKSVQRGDADVMVAGGADSMINHMGVAGFSLLQAAATAPVEPALLCRPFDRKRSGLVIGEGAGIAILEEAEHAKRRGARVYGEVAGYGSSLDAYQVTAPEPRGRGAAVCMKRALRDAGLEPSDIDYINAHGTSTILNDAAETVAIKEVFQQWAPKIPISSTKSLIGHLMAAAGGPEFLFTVLSVGRDEIHPTINLTHPDPKCDLDYVPNVKRQHRVRAALSNSFGFGGQNASIVVRKYGDKVNTKAQS
jgi:3-oxoacyl-[acyl-carrier-protein] synthase II